MIKIGLIREGKIPSDNRVAFAPEQCVQVQKKYPEVKIIVQSSPNRCFSDQEYIDKGIEVKDSVDECDILMGIKEVPVEMLIPGKTYYFFSHTKKLQEHNQKLIKAVIKKNITLVDYECLEHEDGTRILGFGFFAGIVGAHNGMMAYGNRTKTFDLKPINAKKTLRQLIHTYFGLKLPEMKIAITGSGRVAHGVLEVMNLLDIHEVEPDDYKAKHFSYPVYVHLKGADLYSHKTKGTYNREEFHTKPEEYISTFSSYLPVTDLLVNGVYWEKDIPRLFEMDDIRSSNFKIQTIADITDDHNGSVPCNIGEGTIKDPVYGVNRESFALTFPYLQGSIDIMAVGNLPNELPRDASIYFGQQILKEIFEGMINGNSKEIDNATITKNGILTKPYAYMSEYAGVAL